ncbi:MAG: site-specific integrase [Pirellulaceae bacterium]|nr:site-specific integrase [Pirellulaceae bacterium]
MSDEIKVNVVEYTDRTHYLLQWFDLGSGKKKTKTSTVDRATGNRKEAEKEAGKLEDDLEKGRYSAPKRMTWAQFRERYEAEVVVTLKATTAKKLDTVFDALEEYIGPKRLRDLTAAKLSFFQTELRNKRGIAETTVSGMLAHLMAALNWAAEMEFIGKAPKVMKPKKGKRQASKMKGRPITGEEFDRMLDCVERALAGASNGKNQPAPKNEREARKREKRLDAARKAAPSWRYYLKGMYFSGLRLSESLELYWDDRDDKLCVDFTGKRPILRIPADLEKGDRDRDLAMAPEFAEFLLQTPKADRTGPVFKLAIRRKRTSKLQAEHVSAVVCKIGKLAGVVVNSKSSKFASLHDLRRSFGERWAPRVMPQVLMELMRHEDISTTMRYYVGRNAQRTADVLWEAHERATGNTLGNNANSEATEPAPEIAVTPKSQRRFI